jgi:hypothetical protein
MRVLLLQVLPPPIFCARRAGVCGSPPPPPFLQLVRCVSAFLLLLRPAALDLTLRSPPQVAPGFENQPAMYMMSAPNGQAVPMLMYNGGQVSLRALAAECAAAAPCFC